MLPLACFIIFVHREYFGPAERAESGVSKLKVDSISCNMPHLCERTNGRRSAGYRQTAGTPYRASLQYCLEILHRPPCTVAPVQYNCLHRQGNHRVKRHRAD